MTGQTITIIGSLFAALALQTVWITHSLGQLGGRITRMEQRLGRIEEVLLDIVQRIARLEERSEHEANR
jgi:hypothetical protein